MAFSAITLVCQGLVVVLSTTDEGRLVLTEGDVGSKVSELERRECREYRERDEEWRVEVEELGGVGDLDTGVKPPFLPMPSFMASASKE